MSGRGAFLVFEGIDVSGKSTQARRVAELHDALFTFEPGDSPLGVGLRHLVLDAATPMEPVTEALMMLTDRSHHVATVIEPALRSGRSVVSDRFFASTLAYQGYGPRRRPRLAAFGQPPAIGSCLPDATILLDLPIEALNERRAHDKKDRFESADLAFHERVREGYLELAEHEGWIVVDAAPSVEVVATVIDQHVAHILW